MNLIESPQVICTCGQIVYEMDTMYCAGCGDVMCQDCYTDCFGCGKMYCCHCSESSTMCLKCNLDRNLKYQPITEKAYLVINGVSTPIKNSAFMIQKSTLSNARDIRLTLEGETYKYLYRSLVERKDEKLKFDYFLYFEKIELTTDDIANRIRESMRIWNEQQGLDDDYYDDYSTLGW
jgi:hypothetical protein